METPAWLGVIVDREHTEQLNTTGMHPVVRFETRDGKTMTVVDPVSGFPPRVGRRVEVLYDPRDPRRARMRTFTRLWLLPATFVALGVSVLVMFLLFAAVGVFLFSTLDAR